MISESGRIDFDTTVQELAEANFSREDVQAVLDRLARHIGLDAISLDATGSVDLEVDNSLEVSLIHLSHFPGVMVAVPIPVDRSTRAAVLRKLLQANLESHAMQGGSFCLSPDGETLMLCRMIVFMDGDVKRIDRELALFADTAVRWRSAIEDYVQTHSDSAHSREQQPGPVSDRIRV